MILDIITDPKERGNNPMFADVNISPPCSVSVEFVEMIANQFPEKLIVDGKADVAATLRLLGFNTNETLYDIQLVEDVYIRNNNFPSEVYKGSFYNGRLSNSLSKKSEEGAELYDFMFSLFSKFDVLNVDDIDEELMECIMTIGSLSEYSK